MKKTFLSIVIAVMAIGVGHAQIREGMIAQPTHIVGKRINADGEVTSTLEADFTYHEDGRPQSFRIPDYYLSTYYTYIDEYLNREDTWHNNGDPSLGESIVYNYEEGKIKTIVHDYGYEFPDCWEYNYGEDGRLVRKDYMNGLPQVEDYHMHYFYDYENGGQTKIENYWTSWPLQGWLLRKKTI